ncbi:bifunctional endoribonuclease/protein kinase [Saccharomycopsis crataegensis]|uniref:non-specific serine/threonine protein kinase n=1 Tax=Saccharomycopsis crataegensis TaxID=43959 RepID=A0AAV5QKN4_9ASCO|nr:bifunctional endoribonuclease/protein kinase [Saccharomycopsis crataegensis]
MALTNKVRGYWTLILAHVFCCFILIASGVQASTDGLNQYQNDQFESLHSQQQQQHQQQPTEKERNFRVGQNNQVFLSSNKDVNELQLTNLIIVSQVDGSLTGINRQTGEIIWNLDLGPVIHSSSTKLMSSNLINNDRSNTGSTNNEDDTESGEYDNYEEFWAVEPYGEGSLYFFTKESGLNKVPFSVGDLVMASPFSVDNDDKVFTGTRKSSMVYANVKTGELVDNIAPRCCQNSGLTAVISKSAKTKVSQTEGVTPEQQQNENDDKDSFICLDECDNFIAIGRTDYELLITSKSDNRLWEISYSHYGENNLYKDLKLQNLNSHDVDGSLVFPFQEKSLLSIDVDSSIPKWVAKLNSTCINVFDVYTDISISSNGNADHEASPNSKFVLVSHPIKPPQQSSRDSGSSQYFDNDKEPIDHGTYLGLLNSSSWFAMSSQNYPSLVKSSSLAKFYNNQETNSSENGDKKVAMDTFIKSVIGVHNRPQNPNRSVSTTIVYDSKDKKKPGNNGPGGVKFPSLVQGGGRSPKSTGNKFHNNGYNSLPESDNRSWKRGIPTIDPPNYSESSSVSKSSSVFKLMVRLFENSIFTAVLLILTYYSSRAGLIPPLITIMYNLGFMKRTHRAVEFAERIMADTEISIMKDDNNAKKSNHDAINKDDGKSKTPEITDKVNHENSTIGEAVTETSSKESYVESSMDAGANAVDFANSLGNSIINESDISLFLDKKNQERKTKGNDLEESLRLQLGISYDVDIDIQMIKEKLIQEIKDARSQNEETKLTTVYEDDNVDSVEALNNIGDGKKVVSQTVFSNAQQEDDESVGNEDQNYESHDELVNDEKPYTAKKVMIDKNSAHHESATADSPNLGDQANTANANGKSIKKRKRGSRGGKGKKKSNLKQQQQQQQQQQLQEDVLDNQELPPSNLDEEIIYGNDVELVVTQKNRNELGKSRLVISDDILGYGSHGTVVYKGTFENRPVAVKRMLIDFYDVASHEVTLLQESDDHPNVIRYFCSRQSDRFLYIALELCSANLEDLVEKKGSSLDLTNGKLRAELPGGVTASSSAVKDVSMVIQNFKHRIIDEELLFKNFQDILYQMTSGLHHLHKLHIVHRDIKPQNILVTPSKTRDLRVLISDFGLCKKLEPDQSSFRGTTASGTSGWRAPELLMSEMNNSKISKMVDVFSLGLVFYYVLSAGQHPFGDRYSRESNILQNKYDLSGIRFTNGYKSVGAEAKDLISKMLESNPKKRLTAEEVLKHPFFWSNDKKVEFLLKVSDKLNIVARDAPLIHEFESGSETVFNGSSEWKSQFDEAFFANINTFRKYDSTKVMDLLRVIRNKYHHINEIPPEFAITEENFLQYFGGMFPQLLIYCYYFIESNMRSDFESFYN